MVASEILTPLSRDLAEAERCSQGCGMVQAGCGGCGAGGSASLTRTLLVDADLSAMPDWAWAERVQAQGIGE